MDRVERGSTKDSVVHGFLTRQIYPNEKKGDSDQCNIIGVSKSECVMQSAGQQWKARHDERMGFRVRRRSHVVEHLVVA